MPELPEVQTVVNFLEPLLRNKTFDSILPEINFNKVLVGKPLEFFKNQLKGQKVTRVWRRGKYIVLDLPIGHLLIHLRMTGQLFLKSSESEPKKHIRAVFQFLDGPKMYFKDTRKFGRITFMESLDSLNSRLGLEPLSEAFTAEWLYKGFKSRNRMLKALLLDQSFIAGLGNIYVDEFLWSAGIHPRSISSRLGRQKITLLHRTIITGLKQAIKLKGTTIINFTFGDGATGSYQENLKVFGKQKTPCPRCKTSLKKIYTSQRGTHFCPRCQIIK
ncbi:MAG: DNA-formamidopyrimidine glycosylase [Candidatus Neomarinimicrobiota bacterium]